MSIQEKFEKAANVIRNLPKNGSYQPSHELKLRFYAYFKQATEGPNHHTRPGFWEVVQRAKWDAWAKLGNMTKEEAMLHYVDELRKIVETMSYTDNVANFLNSLDNFYEQVPAEDLELLMGPVIEKIRSRPNSPLNGSPLASRDTSPARTTIRLSAPNGPVNTKHITSSLETSPTSSYSASPLPPDTDNDDDDEDEHFLDTQTEPDRGKDDITKKSRLKDYQSVKDLPEVKRSLPTYHCSNHIQDPVQAGRDNMEEFPNRLSYVENKLMSQRKSITGTKYEMCNGVAQTPLDSAPTTQDVPVVTCEAFTKAIESLTKEMENLQRRMTVIENRKQEVAATVSRRRGAGGGVLPRWWGLSLPATTVLLAWPLLLFLIARWSSHRKRH